MERLHGEFSTLAANAGLRLDTVPARLTLQSDGALLERVLRNLLANAVRYTKQGRILFGVRRRAASLRIEVWDTGIGIADSQLDRIFQDFYQVGNAARDRREGLGMGLSIAKRLVQMLGGTIDVTSRLGRGSCFAITLPNALATDSDGRADSALGGGDGDLVDGSDALILLVEDDAVIRMALALMLEGWGYRVVEAGSVSEAFELLDGELVPDLVLTDYRLPEGGTGLMVMDTVRRRLGRDLPGVLMTGDTSSDRLRGRCPVRPVAQADPAARPFQHRARDVAKLFPFPGSAGRVRGRIFGKTQPSPGPVGHPLPPGAGEGKSVHGLSKSILVAFFRWFSRSSARSRS